MVTQAQIPDWLARSYPFVPRRFTTSRGAGMSYVDEGPRSDEAVLMLHGNPTWSYYYRDLVRELAPRLRCVVPDHIGMGLSDKPERYDYSLEARIQDIGELVASLGLNRMHLVVHDWGGAIGMGLAVRRPRMVGRMVLLNTAAFPAPWIPARIALCRAPVVGEWIVRGLNGFAGPATWMAMHARKLGPDERRAYLFPYDSWAHRVGVHRFVQDIPMEPGHPSRATLETIGRGLPALAPNPKILLWGGRDFCFDDRFLERWRGLFPDAEVERYPDAGHYVLEDAGIAVRSRIAEFFSSLPEESR
jgi:haloalkane dehalogenase